MPCSRMDSASSARDASSKDLRGWEEQLSTMEIGRYRLPVLSVFNTSSPRRAPSPRPKPEGFLDAMGTLLS